MSHLQACSPLMRRRVRPTTSFLPRHSHLRGMAATQTLPCPSSTAETWAEDLGEPELPALAWNVEDPQGYLGLCSRNHRPGN